MRNLRKKFTRPKRPWSIEQMTELNALKSDYGLSTTKEIFIAREKLRGFRSRARQLIAVANEAETKVLIGKLVKLGILKPGSGLDDVLALDVKRVLERRLQTIVFRRGMALSMKHARQLITHGRIAIDGVRTKYPSYIVTAEEEAAVGWFRGEPKKAEGPKGRRHVHKKAEEGSAEPSEPAVAQIVESAAAEEAEEPPRELSRGSPEAKLPVEVA